MPRLLAPYLATLATLVALDIVWLGGVAMRWYQDGIGALMAPVPDFAAAGAFYVLYAAGVLAFVVRPRAAGARGATAGWGAAFGFMAYMTYDLTNLATLRGWPLGLSIMDIAWGCLATALAGVVGRIVLDRPR